MTDENGQLVPTPLDEVPLHGFDVRPGSWWGCSQPERRPDLNVIYDGRCPACLIAAEAELHVAGDTIGMANDYEDAGLLMSEFVAEARRIQEELRGRS